MNYYSVAARLLADRHVPFDVILLGYPRESLFDDAAQLERLRSGRYRTVVMAMVDSLSDTHIAALRAFAAVPGQRLAILAPDSTATLDEELMPRARPGAASAFTGVPFALATHDAMRRYYQHSDQAIGDQIFANITNGGPQQLVLMDGAPPSVRVGSVFAHGGDAGAVEGMRSVSLVNYNVTLSGPVWHSLQPRNASISFPACGMCGTFRAFQNLRLSLRCPGDCSAWKSREARYYAPELNGSVTLTVDFAHKPGYGTVVVPSLRSLGVAVIGAGKGEIDARASGAELRRWINRAVTQASGVDAAGPAVAEALSQLQALHGPSAPPVPNQDFTALASQLQPAAAAMKQTVQERTTKAEAALLADKEEVKSTKALLKLDAGALAPTVEGFTPLNANSSGGPGSWQGPNGSAYVQAIDCYGNEDDPLFRTALWSQGPATLRLHLPPGEKIITLHVGTTPCIINLSCICFSLLPSAPIIGVQLQPASVPLLEPLSMNL